MSEQSFNQSLENEISIKEIIIFISESWKSIAISGVIGGLLATGYAFISPPTYEAKANIQVAKVGGLDVEPPSMLVDRLKMPTYYSAESYSACNVINQVEPGEEIVKNLNPFLLKTSPIVVVTYKKNTREDAQKCLEAIVNDIRSNQNLLAKPILEKTKKELTSLKQQMNAAEQIVKLLPSKNSSFDFSDSKFSASVLLFATFVSKENEINNLRTQINNLEFSLTEPQTKETFLTVPIHIPNQNVSPKRPLILMGGVVGLFLGFLFMIGKRSWRTYKTSNQ